MQKFEKNLRKIQSNIKPLLTDADLDIPFSELDILRARGLIEFKPYYDNQIRLRLTDKGITYFDDKRDQSRLFWKEHLVNFMFGFISGVAVTLITTWLITIWTAK